MADDKNKEKPETNETGGPDDKTAKVIEELRESVRKLEAKNREILDEKKKAKEEAEAAKEKADEAAAKEAEKAGDVEKLKKQLEEKYEKQIGKLKADFENATGTIHKLVVEQGLTAALQKANVAAPFADAARALIKTSNEIKVDGDAATIGGKPLADFVTEWATGDQGRHFIAAPANGGAGATGSGTGSASGKGENPFTKDNYNMTEQAKLLRENPQLAAKMKQEATAVGKAAKK